MQSGIKSVLVIGGSGALGKSVVNTFKNINPGWNILNIDLSENKEANQNIILDKNYNKLTILDLLECMNGEHKD